MQTFSLKSHLPDRAAQPSAFFVQSRGRNTGRPSYAPRRNCYVIACQEQDLSVTYWLVYALWKSGHFRRNLQGTRTPYIRVGHMRHLIARAVRRYAHELEPVQQLQKTLQSEMRLIRELDRVARMRTVLLADLIDHIA
ncbi:DUF6943 family protein [Chitinophaga lutea]